MGCQVGVEAANLTTLMTDDKTETSKSYDTIKLGIDAHAKWYYVARQLDGATPQPVWCQNSDDASGKPLIRPIRALLGRISLVGCPTLYIFSS